MHLPFLDKFPADVVILQKRGKSLSARKDKARYMERHGTAYYETKKFKAKFKPSSFDDFIIQHNGRPMIFIYEYQRDMFVPVNATNLQAIHEVKDNKIVMQDFTHTCFDCKLATNPKTTTTTHRLKGDEKKEVCIHCGSDDIKKLDQALKHQPKVHKFINLHAIDEGMAFWGSVRRWKAEERHKLKSFWADNMHFVMYAMTWVLMIVLTYLFMSSLSESSFEIANALSSAVSKPPG